MEVTDVLFIKGIYLYAWCMIFVDTEYLRKVPLPTEISTLQVIVYQLGILDSSIPPRLQ